MKTHGHSKSFFHTSSMKGMLALSLAAQLYAGCADVADQSEEGDEAGEVGGIKQAIGTGWLTPVSEENRGDTVSQATCGSANTGIDMYECSGQYCDNNALHCATLKGGMTTSGDGSWEDPTISEESGTNPWTGQTFYNTVLCDRDNDGSPDGIMDGLKATGQYSDNLTIHCRHLAKLPVPGAASTIISGGKQSFECHWSGWFSEEQGIEDFGTGWFVVGLKCSGEYCDNVNARVCHFQL